MSLYTDRGAHYFHTPKAGGEIDRGHPTQVGRALEQLGIEHIGACSPQAQRPLGAGVPYAAGPIAQGTQARRHNRHGGGQRLHPRRYLPEHNARFAVEAAGEGSAFTPIPGVDLDEILCVEEERQVGNDNCVSYRTLKLQIPEPDAAPFRQGAGQGARLSRRLARRLSRTPMHRPLRRERQAQGRTITSIAPLKSARRRNAVDGMDKPPACPPRPQQNKTRRSGHLMCYQNRTT